MPPRRFTTLCTVVACCVVALFLISSSIETPSPGDTYHLSPEVKAEKSRFYGPSLPALPSFPKVTSFRIPFRPSSHKPPEQQNSTSGEARWYSDWKWLNPFSSTITLDEHRSVLPPLQMRPPVYTFYDSATKKDEEMKKADHKLLVTWRRAWWAQGFRPIVLGRKDAMENPLYESLQRLELEPALEFEVARWLAWGHMGTGILSNWLCLPMAPYDDNLLSYLRRGEYPTLTRYENLATGLFSGEKTAINNAVSDTLKSPKLKHAKSILDAIPPEHFHLEQPTSLAYYDIPTIQIRYPALAKALLVSPSAGGISLVELIDSHLHITFQNTFTKGIAVIKPQPQHTTALVSPTLRLATLLTQCPLTLIPASCPPNRPKCQPCIAAHPLRITQPAYFKNNSQTYTIGTLPHPYTLIALTNQTETISVKHIRRSTARDPWLCTVTKDILGTGLGGPSRVVKFKEAVASTPGPSRSLWLNVESLPASFTSRSLPETLLDELDWHFGFPIPRNITSHGKSQTPVPGPERLPPPPKPEYPVPSEKDLGLEVEILGKAREVLKGKGRGRMGIREVSEAWSLADTEVWRFVRAYRVRSVVERRKWEEEEMGFEGVGGLRGRWWGR